MALNPGGYRADPYIPGAVLAAPLDSSGVLSLTSPQAPTASPAPAAPVTAAAAAAAAAASQAPMASSIVPVGPVASQAIGGDPEAISVELSNSSALGHFVRGSQRLGRLSGRGGGHAAHLYREPIAVDDDASVADFDLASQVDRRPDELLQAAHGADLIADAIPIAGESLESLDEFVRQLEAVDVVGMVSRGPTPAAYVTVAITGLAASVIAARELARRRSRYAGRFRVLDPIGRELALSFPDLPRSWSGRP